MADKLSEIERILHDYTGPFSHYVIKKQMAQLGIDADNCTSDQLELLLKKVLEASIYDSNLRKQASKQIRAALRECS